MVDSIPAPMRVVGRYALYGEIAAGGMATVHFGRLLGPVGFSRTVAIKRLHPQFAKDPEFVSMFLDEARLAARIRHPNVVPTLDVVATQGELFLVMDYVQGESLSRLARGMREHGDRIPPRIVASIMSGALHGLHAAHEARNERGEPLGIVHRDISPQNVLVGTDGVSRVLDFGVAKAAGRIQTTREGQLKGKLAYMAPEQLNGQVSRKTDIYAASIVLWEALTGRRLFAGDNEAAILGKVLHSTVDPPSKYMVDARSETLEASTLHGLRMLDQVTLRGLDRNPDVRFNTAREMAIALERCIGLASPSEVGEWVENNARDVLLRRAEKIAEIESTSSSNYMQAGELVSHLRTSDGGGEGGSGPSPNGGQMVSNAGQSGGYQVSRAANTGNFPAAPSRPNLDNSSSQLSSISLSKPGDDSMVYPPPNRRLGVLFALVSLLVAAAAVFATVLVVKVANKPQPAIANTTTPSTSEAAQPAGGAPTATASTTANATQPPPSDATPDAGSATASAANATAPAATHVAPRATAHATFHVTPPPPKPTATQPPKNCDPPYTLDSSGRKHYKVECL